MDGSDRPQYQLRRIGKPASIIGVKDIMKLNADVTRFGRHSHNDFYLDSSQLAHFISRWHSEIHRVEQEGEIKYIIRDNSLNGTYVNDVRVRGNSVLKESDIIIFGHTNGKNVKPGQKALQADSEFKFVFEKVTPQLNNSIVNSSFQESSVLNGVSSSHHSPAIPVQAPLQESSNGVVLKDISNTNCSSGTGLVPLDSLITQQAQSEEGGNPHTTLPADGSDDDIFNSDESDDDDDKSTSAITTGSTTILTTASAMRPVHTPPPPSKAELRGSSPTPKRGRPPKSSQKSNAQQTASKIPPEPPNTATAASKKRKKSTGPAQTPTPQNKKQTKEEKEKEAEAKRKRKRRGPLQKPSAAGARRSKRRKSDMSGSPSESHSDSEDESGEEDYSYHYDGDACEAYDCTKPMSDKVSWVQCDDCDRWYHTCCVGCSFEMVAQDNTQFHCGCK